MQVQSVTSLYLKSCGLRLSIESRPDNTRRFIFWPCRQQAPRCTHLIFRLKKDPYTYTSSTWFSATWRLQVIGHDSQQKFCSNRTAGHCFVLSHILTMLISKVFLYFAQTLSETKRNSVPLTQAVNTRITFF